MNDRDVLDYYRQSPSWAATARHFDTSVKLVKNAVRRATLQEHHENYQRQTNQAPPKGTP